MKKPTKKPTKEPTKEPMQEPRNATLEIVSDTEAYIVRGTARYQLAGGMAGWIIAVYRHQLTHGEVAADTFLLGVVSGMQHMTMVRSEEILEEVKQHRETILGPGAARPKANVRQDLAGDDL
jgi:hypothetical protein